LVHPFEAKIKPQGIRTSARNVPLSLAPDARHHSPAVPLIRI
jgi:hypothetical protein